MNEVVIPKCDQCDKPAVKGERDLIETPNDGEWATFVAYGDWRYGCRDHFVKWSRIYRLSDPDYPLPRG